MPLAKLTLRPDAQGYSVSDGQDVIAIELDGGAMRYSRDKWGSTSRVSATWTLLPDQYQYLRAFYNTTIAKGALPFLCDLILDDPSPVEHVCRIIPGTMNLGSQQGFAYISSCTLEVEPVMVDIEYDTALVMLYDEYGDGAYMILNLLEKLVNVDLPANL